MSLSPWLRDLIKRPTTLPGGRCRERKVDRAVRPRLQDVLEDRLCPSGGYLLVASTDTNSVMRYDEVTGAPAPSAGSTGATFVSKNSGGLSQPVALVLGPQDHNLYVSSGLFGGNPGGNGHPNAVLRYEGPTSPDRLPPGTFLDDFADSGQLTSARGVVFGPDGNLYVADGTGPSDGTVVVYDGKTGAFLRDFVPRGADGLAHPGGLVFGPDGKHDGKLDLYVASAFTDSILRFSFSRDGTTGVPAPSSGNADATFVSANNGLDHPFALTFGPDGNLYVAAIGLAGQPAVERFDGTTGAPRPSTGNSGAVFVAAGSGGLISPQGLIFGPDGTGDGRQDLYVTSVDLQGSGGRAGTSTVLRYNGVTGAPAPAPGYTGATFIPANSGGLDDPSFLIFTETDPTTLAYTGTTTAQANAASAVVAIEPATISNPVLAPVPLAPAMDTPGGGVDWLLDLTGRPRHRAQQLGNL
jgi:glucose/arabinose dehydrogenase